MNIHIYLHTVDRYKKSIATLVMLLWLLPLEFAWSDYPAAPEFRLPTETNPVALTELKGKLVFIDFWASWCRPCKNSFPWMISMKNKYRQQGLEIVAINLDEDPARAKAFLASQKINFIIAYDPAAEVASKYQIEGMPSSYLVDNNGKLRVRYTGFWNRSKDEKEKMIQKLLSQL